MKTLFRMLAATVLIVATGVLVAYAGSVAYMACPIGRFEKWRTFYSPSEGRKVMAWRFGGVWYEDRPDPASPLDQGTFWRMSGQLLEEVLEAERRE
jgi:hypothetical protein